MPKRVRRSPEFGRWVRDTRTAAGKSQKQLAKSTSLAQQYLSRVESQGLVPSDDELARICEAVGRPVQEARDVLAKTSASEEYARVLEEEFDSFITWLLGLDGPVHIYVVRDSPEPVNPISVGWHCSILQKKPDLYISILFRHSYDGIWQSFRALARDIDATWTDSDVEGNLESDSDIGGDLESDSDVGGDLESDDPQKRISGYYRNPEVEEGKGAIPMAVPVILVKVKSAAYLFCYGSHQDVFDVYKQSGEEDYLERFKRIVLLPAPHDSASLFAEWIGASHTNQELSPQDWVRIQWPSYAAY